MRALAACTLCAMLARAPLQCSHAPDPNERREDTAGDALWAYAHEQKGRHEDAAARETLQYLVERYPSSRYAPAAREELGMDGGS